MSLKVRKAWINYISELNSIFNLMKVYVENKNSKINGISQTRFPPSFLFSSWNSIQ